MYEVCAKRNGKVLRRRLDAQTPTDAVREQRPLLAKLDARGFRPETCALDKGYDSE